MDVLTLQAPLGCTFFPEYSEYSLPLSEAAGWFVSVTFLLTEQVLRVRSHTAHHFHPSSPPSREIGNGGDCYPCFLFQINIWIQRGRVTFLGSHSMSMTYLAVFFSPVEMVDW